MPNRRRVEVMFRLPPYCFAEYTYEADPSARLGIDKPSKLIGAVCDQAIGYCDGAQLPHGSENTANAWAVMYEDRESFKCWSLLPKDCVEFLPEQSQSAGSY